MIIIQRYLLGARREQKLYEWALSVNLYSTRKLERVRTALHRGATLPLLVLCGFALLLMWRSVLGDIFLPLDIVPHQHPWRFSYERVPVNNPINSDIIQQVYPRRQLTRLIVSQGAWPLWNPTILTGTPLLADGQSTFFYLPSVLFLILPLAQAFGYYAILQVVLAGVGSYAFARRLGLDRGAATLTGICYMFSGYVLSWLQFPHHSGAMAMLPWCFWAIERACQGKRWAHWAAAGVVLALPLLAHIQLSFYIYVGTGCYLLARVVEMQPWKHRLSLMLGYGLAVVLALALSAVQLVPQVALSAEGQRGDEVTEEYTASTQFVSILRLMFPLIGGQPRAVEPQWGPELLQAPQPYAGLAPLGLAVVAVLLSRHRATTIFTMLSIGALALALRTPLLQVFMTLVPPYRQFTDHNRWYALWGFTIAVLAGLGAQALVERGRRSRVPPLWTRHVNRTVLAIVILSLATWTWQHLALFTPQSRYGEYITLIRQHPLTPVALFAVCSVVVIAVLASRRVPRLLAWAMTLTVVVADVLWYGGNYNTTTNLSLYNPTTDLVAGLASEAPVPEKPELLYPPARQLAFFQSQPKPFRIMAGDYPALQPNLATAYELEDVRGYQSLYLARYNRLARLIDGKDYTEAANEGGTSLRPYFTSAYSHRRLLDMLNVQFIFFPPGSKNPPLYEPLQLVHQSDEGTIYRNPQALPRAWLVHSVETIADDTAQLDRMARDDFDPATTAVVSAAPPPVGQLSTADRVEELTYEPNAARIRATTGSAALLVLSDAYTDDWRVTVDGTPATLYRTNYALRGVWLPPGTHEVVFSYRPVAFMIGGVTSASTLGLLVVAASWYHISNRRRNMGQTAA